MVVSEAKREANRRNARLSTGPQTASGKSRSSLNATKHGLRAETLILFDEDPQVLEDRRAAWRACLLPSDDVEDRLVDDAVVHTWHQDRARRAQAKRINANITNYGVDQGRTDEKEVEDLGWRLFTDRLGALAFYPTGCGYDEGEWERNPSTSFAGNGADDPDRPSVLVLSLQSTLLGCEWMLGEWAKLKAILDKGQPWVSSDKLKAVRLLGKQPYDVIDETDVAVVFLASFVLKGEKGRWYREILLEMNDTDTTRFRQNAADRQLESLKPADAAQARQVLLAIIERATEPLTAKAEAHRERARVMAELVPDILAFDDTPDGERLRRFDLASGRGLARSLGELRKHRRDAVSALSSVVSCPLSVSSSVVSGPLSVVNCGLDAVAERSAPNEPIDGPFSVVNCPLPVASCNVEAVDAARAPDEPTEAVETLTNEPTVVREDVTNEPTSSPFSVVSCPLPVNSYAAHAGDGLAPNEPTVAHENAPNEPTVAHENASNEPTATGENVTNEATSGPLSVVSCPLPVNSCAAYAVAGSGTANEPTAAGENVTNEATRGPSSVVSCSLPVVSCTAHGVYESEIPNEPTVARENALNEATERELNGTNEPKLVADGKDGETVELSASAHDENGDDAELQAIIDGEDIRHPIAAENPHESLGSGNQRIRKMREESVRKLNEEARREAEAAMAARSAHLREQKRRNAKLGNQPKGREGCTGHTGKKETAARNKKKLDRLVDTVFGLYKEARRAPS